METASLIFLVFLLGVRHGLDADHLAFIDGQIRYNWRIGSPIARWVGTLFSFGHGAVVASIAIILGLFFKSFTFPAFFDTFATWVAILSLFLIGTLNISNLLRAKKHKHDFELKGIKGKLIPKILRETSNPFVIILLGGLFALAADTVSQTSVWAISAVNSNSYMPIILGLVFMVGMMLTDTLDSLIAYRMISQTSKIGQSASRMIGWLIVTLAYGVSFYLAFTFFFPIVDVDFEIVGLVSFLFLVLCFGVVSLRGRMKTA
ncbi:nickel/cobalt efflux system [Paenibacillus baekrokdamisoli]|uniref:Nickel/cobalt efflux system n=1 Tax=Paenibacillus baekrokdamisoli TaxID=1712516 RepID=A0A3G9IPU4_9BACL|nr:sodium:proton antiporter [Paenibacillus baekrokdamisoli]MBB3072084.1 high-affinity nickel-transport protein [Paenibacillus baekrokdamisoli]BBH20386.1 nickel/cobalt efflux system [Paenibacillus baekrokdamisoli]